MNKLTFEKRVWIVKQKLKGISAGKIALAQKVNRSAVYQILLLIIIVVVAWQAGIISPEGSMDVRPGPPSLPP